jgi:hypothetical protein
MLLEETYEAAERLKRSFDGGALAIDECTEMAETACEDLDCIVNTRGVAALVGNTYGAAKDVGAYVTGEATRGLLILKRKNVNDAQLRRECGCCWPRRAHCADSRTKGQLKVEMV